MKGRKLQVKGVNLGNWLVMEKWMSPSLFEGTDAEDEYYLPTQRSREVYEARIRIHRAEYITERDFTMIKAMGLGCHEIASIIHISREIRNNTTVNKTAARSFRAAESIYLQEAVYHG